MGELGQLPGTRITARSSLYRTAPMVTSRTASRPAAATAGSPQPDYFNAVVGLATTLSPQALMAALLDIEQRHGRVRSVPNAPRTLDLDLLLYGDEVLNVPGLTLPHPRMHLRRFVLEPLLEIAPDCMIPGAGPANEWHARTLDQAVEKLATPHATTSETPPAPPRS